MDYYPGHLASHEQMHGTHARELCLFVLKVFQPRRKPHLDSPGAASGAWGEGTAKGLSEAQLQALCAVSSANAFAPMRAGTKIPTDH